ncbi:MAG: phosphoribosylaminoimidazole carboxylase [Anaerolineae bacterium]|nr:phosphoribosylaminoimidazole carboxylase [Anaerolineae bacterium]
MADVIIIMGSKSDMPHVDKITAALSQFELTAKLHVSSAHKSPAHLLRLLAQYEADPAPKVYITVAGRSNALSGMVDACVTAPVIACPPYSDSFGGADVFSSLRMPSGVTPALVLEPANAALLAAKILGRIEQVRAFQQAQTEKLIKDNESLQ